jgi:hypothetical protein
MISEILAAEITAEIDKQILETLYENYGYDPLAKTFGASEIYNGNGQLIITAIVPRPQITGYSSWISAYKAILTARPK